MEPPIERHREAQSAEAFPRLSESHTGEIASRHGCALWS